MDRVYELNAVNTPPTYPTMEIGYPSETAGVATTPGAWWYHMITEELRAVVVAANITPAGNSTAQLLAAINALIGANGGGGGGSSATATNLAGGAANKLAYQTGPGATSFVAAPSSAGTYLQWNGSSFVWATPASGGGGGITGGAANQIVVMAGPNSVTFIPAPTTPGTVLGWNNSQLGWAAPSAGAVASLAASMLGGFANEICYQSGPSQTAYILAPTSSGTYLMWNGSNFVWSTPSGGGGGGGSVAGGNANQIVYQVGAGSSGFISAPSSAGTYLQWNGSSFVWATPASGGGGSSYPTPTTANTYLEWTGSAYAWVSLTGLSATGLQGGAANQIPYQSGAGATSFIGAPSSAGTYLQWNGSSFTWAAGGSGSTATNLAGGAYNQIPVQTGSGTTTFIPAPPGMTAGISMYVLAWDGSFYWSATTTGTIGGSGAGGGGGA